MWEKVECQFFSLGIIKKTSETFTFFRKQNNQGWIKTTRVAVVRVRGDISQDTVPVSEVRVSLVQKAFPMTV